MAVDGWRIRFTQPDGVSMVTVLAVSDAVWKIPGVPGGYRRIEILT